jgi:ATP-binding cassette subfamily B protein
VTAIAAPSIAKSHRIRFTSAVRASRRFLAPEVIQTSAMDCGPAALKCLLEGFGIPVSYGRLREACQTSVDGTSIDTLEALACTVGLEAEQVMIPADHLLLPEAEAFPAIVPVLLPSRLMHFVVVWSVRRGWVQVMDPARGRRWVRGETFLRDVYTHTMSVPAASFREWAGSEAFLGPLARRMRALEGGDRAGRDARARAAQAMIDRAVADHGWRPLAALDGATRMASALVAAGAVAPGAEAWRLVEAAAAEPSAELLAAHATAWSAPPADDGSEQVMLRGTPLVRVSGAAPLGAEARAALPVELRAAVDEPRARPAAELLTLLRRDGLLRWTALAAGLGLAAGGAVLEALLFRGLFDAAAGRGAGLLARLPVALRPGGGGALVLGTLLFLAAMLALELPLAAALRGAGGRLEMRLRRAFLRKIPRLGDRYFQSRPVSDMAERAHVLHRLRALPALGGQLLRTVLELAVIAGALSWIYPRGAPLALALAAAQIAIPLLAQPALGERDMRMRNHAGALALFYLDALLGLVAIRTHRAEEAIAREHAGRLAEWVAAARAALRAALAAETLQALVGFGLAAALLAGFVRARAGAPVAAGTVLLVVYWALSLPALGQEIAFLVQQYPAQRNVTLRLVEPLGAPEEGQAETRTETTTSTSTGIEMRDVVVRVGGNEILAVEKLEIAEGEHVAIVGPSGAGKSTLVGLLLGWHRPAEGSVEVGGVALRAAELEALRRTMVWVDPTVYLWNRPLHPNVAYGLLAAPASLEEAIAEAELGDAIERLPGLEAPLGEAGALLSGGEGQRVRYARGVARVQPRLVILDEPFRGLARDQRRALLARARHRWAGATLVCITHDIAETLAFPRALVLEGGRIVEDGAPEELRARAEGRYAALHDAEARVRRAAWSAAAVVKWRRLRLEDGRLTDGGAEPT